MSNWRVKPWLLAIPLFALIVLIVPVKAVAIPGFLVLWMACLAGSWLLLRTMDDE